MPTLVECPMCRRQLQVPEELVGKRVQCPGCGQTFTTAAAAREPSGAPPASPAPPEAVPAREPLPERPADWEPYDRRERPRFAPRDDVEHPDFDRGGARERGKRVLAPPAICLLVTGFLGLLGNLYWLASVLVQSKDQVMQQMHFNTPEEEQIGTKVVDFIMGPAGLATVGVFILICVLIILGAIAMLVGRMRWLAVFGSILAMVNFWSCCCVLGLPFGIWSLIALSRPEARAVFQRAPVPTQEY